MQSSSFSQANQINSDRDVFSGNYCTSGYSLAHIQNGLRVQLNVEVQF